MPVPRSPQCCLLMTLDFLSSSPSSTTVWFPLDAPVLELPHWGLFVLSSPFGHLLGLLTSLLSSPQAQSLPCFSLSSHPGLATLSQFWPRGSPLHLPRTDR